ncbi:MAG: hypothetical protein NVSMB5_18430 [Candidatus Velthaea sp.]
MGKGRILKIAAQWIRRRDQIEIAVEPKDVQDRGIRADRDPHASVLDAPQRHDRHACPFRDEFCREPPTESSRAEAVAKP